MNFLGSGLYLGVLFSSLIGSLHCVGMCSGLMVNVAHHPRENFLYHLGRLLGYMGLGAVAGYLGESIFSSELLRSLQLFTTLAVGMFFCWMAIKTWKNQAFHFSIIPNSTLLKLQKWSLNRKLISPAFLIGLLSALLPCGWLHTYVIAALATRSPYQGAILLFFFWLGTVPALLASLAIIRKVTTPLAKYSSKVLAVILLGIGLSTLSIKLYPQFTQPAATEESCPFHPSH